MLTANQENVLDLLDGCREPDGRIHRDRFASFHGKTVNSLIRAGYLKPVGDGLFELCDPREGGEEKKPGRVTHRKMDRYRRKHIR